MKAFFVATAAAAAVLLSGCTTLDDFIDMTPQERAQTVCRNASEIKQLAERYEEAVDQARTAQDNLTRGYLLHRDCRWVTVPDGSHTDCWRDRQGNTHCSTRPMWRRVQECVDIPVAMDRAAETQKLQAAQSAAAAIKKSHDDLYLPCLERAARLQPADAYDYYDNHRMP